MSFTRLAPAFAFVLLSASPTVAGVRAMSVAGGPDAAPSCPHALFANPHYGVGDEPQSVAIGDLDGANGPDLAVANVGSDDVWVLFNRGDGTFAAPVVYDLGSVTSVAIGDLDGVNGPDLAVAGEDVSVLLNQGDGTFAAAVAYDPGGRSVAIGDLDGVNGPDLAVAGGDVSVLLNQGNGTFAAAVAYEVGIQPQSVAIGDLDGVNGGG